MDSCNQLPNLITSNRNVINYFETFSGNVHGMLLNSTLFTYKHTDFTRVYVKYMP